VTVEGACFTLDGLIVSFPVCPGFSKCSTEVVGLRLPKAFAGVVVPRTLSIAGRFVIYGYDRLSPSCSACGARCGGLLFATIGVELTLLTRKIMSLSYC
jgi:hypothetical protein